MGLQPGLLSSQGLTGAGRLASMMTCGWKVDAGCQQGTSVHPHVHSLQDSLNEFMTWPLASFRVCDPKGHSESRYAVYNLALGIIYLLSCPQVSPD